MKINTLKNQYIQKILKLKPYLGKHHIKAIMLNASIHNRFAVIDVFRGRTSDINLILKVYKACLEISKENREVEKNIIKMERLILNNECAKEEKNLSLNENFLANCSDPLCKNSANKIVKKHMY